MPEPITQIAAEFSKLSSLLPKLYEDLAKPGAQQVGKALETVLGLGNTILWPLAWANARAKITLDRNLERYRESLAHTPLKDITSVAPEVGVPIAEKLSYVNDNTLAELYILLLNTASTGRTAHLAHPSFVHVINNLAPDEARLLDHLRRNISVAFVHAKAFHPEDRSFVSLDDLIFRESVEHLFAFPQNVPAYVMNATGLGLIEVKRNQALSRTEDYEIMMDAHRTRLEKLMRTERHLKNHELRYEKGIVTVPPYGKMFLAACTAGES